MGKTAVADDITVTTATRTEDEVRASLAPPPVADDKKVETPAAGEKQADEPLAPEIEDEADSDRPDPEVSEAARKLRMGRADQRTARLRDDIALYEENLRALGVKVTPLEKREYKSAQAEIDAYSRRRNELLRDFTKALKTKPAAARREDPPARPATPPAASADKTPASTDAPKFEFPVFDDWQVKNPDKDYTDYTDARTDARYEFNRQTEARTRATEARQQAEADAVSTFESAVETFKADHADYDEATAAVNLDALGPERLQVLRAAMLREGTNAPALLYHLAKNADDVARLAQTRTVADLYTVLGELRYASRTTAAPPPAREQAPPPPPARPTTSAPAPLRGVSGSATVTRSAADLVGDDDDADAYIEKRRQELRQGR